MAFKDYIGTPLMPFVLPIIPVGAKLSPKSKLKPERIGKIPGCWTDDGWTGYVDFTNTRASAKMLGHYDNWFKLSGYDDIPIVGVLGEAYPAIDVDCEDLKVIEIVEEAIETITGRTTLTRIRTNSNRRLYKFKWKGEPAKKYKSRFYTPGAPKLNAAGEPIKPSEIEFLGRGQQYLIEGKHPSGAYYEWLLGLTPAIAYEMIVEVDAEQWQAIRETIEMGLALYGCDFDIPNSRGATGSGTSTAAAAEIGSEHFDRAPSLEDLTNLLKAFPATHPELADRDQWITFLRAIKAACGGDGQFYEDVVVPWNLKFPGLERDYLDERWNSFHDSSMGWSYLVSVAQADAPEFVASLFPELDLSVLEGDPDEEKLADQAHKIQLGLDDNTLAGHFVEAYARKDWCVQTRYHGEKPKWMRFVNGIWRPDQLSIVEDLGQVLSRISKQVLADPNSNAKRREAAMRLKGLGKAKTVAGYVQSLRRMHVPVDRFDRHPWLLGFPGGYIDEDNNLRDPDPGLFISRSLPFAPVFGEATPGFDKLMNNVSMGIEEIHEAIMLLFGCSMSGTGGEQKMPFFEGAGGVGVTTLLELCVACAGAGTPNGYGTVISHKAFVQGNAERFLPAGCAGFYMVVVSEIEKREQWALSTVKQATGGGSMPIEEKGFMGRTVPVTWLLLFQGNDIPIAGHIDKALMQRLIIIPVKGKQIRDTADDVKQYSKLVFRKEGPAILGKLLEARLRYRKRGSLLIPATWRQRTDEYFNLMDVEGHFIGDKLEWGLGDNCAVSMLEAYQNRREWGQETGHTGNPGSLQVWTQKLHQHPMIVEAVEKGQLRFGRRSVNGSNNKQRFMIGARLVSDFGPTRAHTTQPKY